MWHTVLQHVIAALRNGGMPREARVPNLSDRPIDVKLDVGGFVRVVELAESL
jgi:L-fucose isomerase-like protein